MRMLIIEDDAISREVLKQLLSPYGETDVATDGQSAVRAVEVALLSKEPYALICLDIMMPILDGQKTLQSIRALEERHGRSGLDRAKVMMTTALGDKDNIFLAFREQCDAYVVKPVSKERLLCEMRKLELIP